MVLRRPTYPFNKLLTGKALTFTGRRKTLQKKCVCKQTLLLDGSALFKSFGQRTWYDRWPLCKYACALRPISICCKFVDSLKRTYIEWSMRSSAKDQRRLNFYWDLKKNGEIKKSVIINIVGVFIAFIYLYLVDVSTGLHFVMVTGWRWWGLIVEILKGFKIDTGLTSFHTLCFTVKSSRTYP